MTAFPDENSKGSDLAEGRGLRLGIAALIIAYAFFGWFEVAFSPLGLAPQLDAAENVAESQSLFSQEQATEPFYRSPLYPAFLRFLGAEDTGPFLASLVGFCLHLGSAFLLWKIALKLNFTRWQAVLAFALYAIYPLSLFFSALLYDTTVSIFLFLLGIHFGLRKGNRTTLLAGACFALAALVRPHFLPVALVAPFALLWAQERRSLQGLFIGYAPLLLGLLAFGMANQLRSGEFRILPWQGAYNLWAANKPEANGLYFTQSVDVSGRVGAANPAKVESIHLYGQAHPEEEPPYSIDAMNAHWRGKFLEHVLENPYQVFGLWLYKSYAVLHNYEQYNNHTFSFHKARSPFLKFNPLGWGILLLFATFGLLQLFRTHPRLAVLLLLLAASYAAMLILFYASARFRLPLVPILVLLAVNSVGWFRNLHRERKRLAVSLVLLALLGVLTCGSFAEISSDKTYVQDRLLLANANAELGRDATAARWARKVLENHPERAEARRIYTVSYFNLALLRDPQRSAFGSWKEQRQWVRQQPPTDPTQDAVLGGFFWKWGERERAVATWRAVKEKAPTPLAEAALGMLDTDVISRTDLEAAMKNLLHESF